MSNVKKKKKRKSKFGQIYNQLYFSPSNFFIESDKVDIAFDDLFDDLLSQNHWTCFVL